MKNSFGYTGSFKKRYEIHKGTYASCKPVLLLMHFLFFFDFVNRLQHCLKYSLCFTALGQMILLKNPAYGTLYRCVQIIALCQKLNNLVWLDLEHLPVFKALCGDNPEQNAGTIHASNQEQLPVFKAPHRDDPEQNAEQCGTPPCF